MSWSYVTNCHKALLGITHQSHVTVMVTQSCITIEEYRRF